MIGPRDILRRKGDRLCVESVRLDAIAERFGTPTYVYSASAIGGAIRRLYSALEGLNPQICFAVKACSNLSVLREVAKNGGGFDVVSGGELYRAGRVGASGKGILFSGVGKTRDELVQALRYDRGRGVHSVHVESVSELELLREVARDLKVRARVGLRINPEVGAATHRYLVTGDKDSKFGIGVGEAMAQVRKYGRRDPHIQWVGIGAHFGSQILSLRSFERHFASVARAAKEMQGILGAPLEYVDVGGGVGIRYRDEKVITPEAYARALKNYFGRGTVFEGSRVFLEPGRWIVGQAGLLLTRILHVKGPVRRERARRMLVVDAAMTDLIRPALYGAFHEIISIDPLKNTPAPADVVGGVCESADIFAVGRRLPASLEAGDVLAILSAGAYGFTMSSPYNTRPRACEVMVRSDKAREIRRRETFGDLVRGEI